MSTLEPPKSLKLSTGSRIREEASFSRPIASTVKIDVSNGSSKVVEKVKKEGGTSTFIMKAFTQQDLSSISTYVEAVAGDCYRFFSPDSFTKARVVRLEKKDEAGGDQYACVSKVIPEGRYVPVAELTEAELIYLRRHHKKELARFIVAIYCFAESDAHPGNWGIIRGSDENIIRVVKIDHDRSFFDLIARDLELEGPDVEAAGLWPNCIFLSSTNADITQFDIDLLPMATLIKPSYWPAEQESLHLPVRRIANLVFAGLEDDADFTKYKYIEFAKIFLITDENIQAICQAHIADTASADYIKVYSYLTARIKTLRDTLIMTPKFREFFKANREELIKELTAHITAYNAQFLYKKAVPDRGIVKGEVKEKYKDTGFLISKTGLDQLEKEMVDISAMKDKDLRGLDLRCASEALERSITRGTALASLLVNPELIESVREKILYEIAMTEQHKVLLKQIKKELGKIADGSWTSEVANLALDREVSDAVTVTPGLAECQIASLVPNGEVHFASLFPLGGAPPVQVEQAFIGGETDYSIFLEPPAPRTSLPAEIGSAVTSPFSLLSKSGHPMSKSRHKHPLEETGVVDDQQPPDPKRRRKG